MTADTAHLLSNLPPQVVQSIRAFRVPDLQAAAQASGQHFLYANLAHIDTKAEALELIGQAFHLPAYFGKNFDALYDCLTTPLARACQQPGFVVVLDQLPVTAKFDKTVREQLLDCFQDAA
ncbi:MAG: barstar family protein, partial [Comamonas sp.]|nr:barstar family protein [Comamonas sp.]MBP7941020.1 barstar family protein [Comamonas sp.]MBP9973581.1 barstar family protein [Comamonas sp.]HRL39970.1 barstar family protein [Comamonas denitrificans]HRN32412.1 barstar family protein [Comamonas denitrificans]